MTEDSLLVPSRWERMLGRIVRTAEMRGVDEEGLGLVERAFRASMVPRLEAFSDDHHPDYLHSGRTAAILLDDVGLNEPEPLAAACLLDTQRPELEPSRETLSDEVGVRVVELRDRVPRPESPRLMEDLLASDIRVVVLALAERLDHLRHAHMWNDPNAARAAHAEGASVYLPIAERTHPLLARRYGHCCRTFAKKYPT